MTDILSLPFHLQLLVREYGHSTYQLILGLKDIEDVAERSKRAGQIVQLMLRLQPALRELPEVQTRLWNHLHALAGEDVALEAPVPLRSLTVRTEKPARIPYPRTAPKLRAYGAAIEALIAKALTLEDVTEREQATVQIGRTMKFLYRQHNKENAKDVTILRHLGELSGGQLKLDADLVDSENLFEMPIPTISNNYCGGCCGSWLRPFLRFLPCLLPKPLPLLRLSRSRPSRPSRSRPSRRSRL